MESRLYQRAGIDAFIKLDPRHMVRNPVMFVVEVGSVMTTILFAQALVSQGEAPAAIYRRNCLMAVVHRAVRQFF